MELSSPFIDSYSPTGARRLRGSELFVLPGERQHQLRMPEPCIYNLVHIYAYCLGLHNLGMVTDNPRSASDMSET